MEHIPLMQDEVSPADSPSPTAPAPQYQPPFPGHAAVAYPPQQAPPTVYLPQHAPPTAYPPQQVSSIAYRPPQPPAPTTVVMSQPMVQVSSVHFRDVPVQLRCPNCHRDVITRLHTESGMLTWILVAVIFVLGLWPLCCEGKVGTRLVHCQCILAYYVIASSPGFAVKGSCCLIPLFIDAVKDVNHVCPNCNFQVGKYKRIG